MGLERGPFQIFVQDAPQNADYCLQAVVHDVWIPRDESSICIENTDTVQRFHLESGSHCVRNQWSRIIIPLNGELYLYGQRIFLRAGENGVGKVIAQFAKVFPLIIIIEIVEITGLGYVHQAVLDIHRAIG